MGRRSRRAACRGGSDRAGCTPRRSGQERVPPWSAPLGFHPGPSRYHCLPLCGAAATLRRRCHRFSSAASCQPDQCGTTRVHEAPILRWCRRRCDDRPARLWASRPGSWLFSPPRRQPVRSCERPTPNQRRGRRRRSVAPTIRSVPFKSLHASTSGSMSAVSHRPLTRPRAEGPALLAYWAAFLISRDSPRPCGCSSDDWATL
jgi:hypothetical protein